MLKTDKGLTVHSDDYSEFNKIKRSLKPGQVIALEYKEGAKQRSNDQNRWYFGTLLPAIAMQTDETVSELHEIILTDWSARNGKLVKRKVKINDEIVEIFCRKSWSFDKMSSKEANSYIEHVKRWCVETFGEGVTADALIFNRQMEI